MDQNNPENLFNLLSYLNREQYGDRPLFYGPYFNAPVLKSVEGKKLYAPFDDKYKQVSARVKYEYDGSYQTIFPRMYSQQEDHIKAYLKWTNLEENNYFEARKDQTGNMIRDRYGDIVYDYRSPKNKPSFANNIEFFIKYQLGHMYFRYFMWNFAGRQNDIQAHYKEEINKGNWISGIKSIDSKRLGNQDVLPDSIVKNRAHNKYFLLPLVLGLIGMCFHYNKDKKNFWVVMALFFLTGIAIVIYLNQYPIQPRERDYAFAGSFYAFAIWIGISVISLFNAARQEGFKDLSKYSVRGIIAIVVIGIFDMAFNGNIGFTWTAFASLALMLGLLALMRMIGSFSKNPSLITAITIMLTLPVPIIMARQNFDDHNRSGRYVARDLAFNYLNSCEKNAILYTNGDNDTFPLWYAQEVEGIRTDVRVINMSYLSADWYIEQMEQRAYESGPIKMTLKKHQYRLGNRDIVYLFDRGVKGPVELIDALKFVAQDDPEYKTIPGYQEKLDHFPSHSFKMHADSTLVFGNGTIKPEMASKYIPQMEWTIQPNYLFKNHLMALDFFATNNWERPIYFAITVSDDNYNNMHDYFEMQGLAYRIVPAKLKSENTYIGGINTSVMYDNMMNKFRWGGIENPKIYLDETIVRMVSNIRHNFNSLARELIVENKPDSALKALEYCKKIAPNSRVAYDIYMIEMVDSYYKLNEPEKAEELVDIIITNTSNELDYIVSLKKPFSEFMSYEKNVSVHVFRELAKMANTYGRKKKSAEIQQRFEKYAFALQPAK